jgi:excinuclease UvrABC helicase subunit UvrB
MTDFETRQAAEPSATYATKVQDTPSGINTTQRIEELKKMMKKAAMEFDFITAASLRDEILRLEAMKP